MIRTGLKEDIPATCRLWMEMIAEMRPDYTPNPEWWTKIAEVNFSSGYYEFLLNEEDRMASGFVDWFFFPEPSTGKIHAVGQHFYLRPDVRGKGIGRAMYKIALDSAIKKGAENIELFCFDAERPMWERKGFKPIRNLMRLEVDHV